MDRYALALILPQEVEQLLNKLRGEHRGQMTFIALPHVTLGYFVTGADLDVLKVELAQLAKETASVRINLNGINYFESESNTAYVVIENYEQVIRFRSSMANCLQRIAGTTFEERSGYQPHVTIGTDISAVEFPTIRQILSEQEARLEISADTFVLASSGNDGKFKIESLFELSG